MTEMGKLENLLLAEDIPFEIRVLLNTPQILYPSIENCVCDAICHEFSYGGSEGLLEIMGLVSKDCEDDVEGYLTAEEVFQRIKKHYKSR